MRDCTMNNHIFHNLNVDGIVLKESKEKADALTTHFKSVDESLSVTEHKNENTSFDASVNGNECTNDDFNMNEMDNILKEMKNASINKIPILFMIPCKPSLKCPIFT